MWLRFVIYLFLQCDTCGQNLGGGIEGELVLVGGSRVSELLIFSFFSKSFRDWNRAHCCF